MPKNTPRILIVEDDTVLLNVLADAFEKLGYDIQKATDGRVAFELARTQFPDLILLDILLPGKDGLTFLKQLRHLPSGERVPVLVLTNVDDPLLEKECRKLGVSEFLVKSEWKIAQVVGKVKMKIPIRAAKTRKKTKR
jgi:two-component system alkaline phosphatase synthesis response regulator PhoP